MIGPVLVVIIALIAWEFIFFLTAVGAYEVYRRKRGTTLLMVLIWGFVFWRQGRLMDAIAWVITGAFVMLPLLLLKKTIDAILGDSKEGRRAEDRRNSDALPSN